jgi:hypothetical protein
MYARRFRLSALLAPFPESIPMPTLVYISAFDIEWWVLVILHI